MIVTDTGPKPGDVWAYPFLWKHQADKGETEGRKYRPCAVPVLIRRIEGHREVLLLPVTTKTPSSTTAYLSVPEIEKKRAGLDSDVPLWIILDQFNTDDPDNSFYLEPDGKIGSFSTAFTNALRMALHKVIKYRKAQRVQRSGE